MSGKSPEISIIVPTYNSAKNINLFLESLVASDFRNFEVIINDDLRTSDDTDAIVKKYSKKLRIVYIRENKMMAQARLKGATYAQGSIIVHLDSDMRVTKALLGEIAKMINSNGFAALVIPEESVGTTFWARCKWLEKKMYQGIDEIESFRATTKDAYDAIGGHDPSLIFSEDKDIDIRMRQAGYRFGRTRNHLIHDEGRLVLWGTLKKKLFYSNTAGAFSNKHPDHFRWQSNPIHRYIIYLKNIKYLFSHPLLYAGAWYMKTAEYLFGALGFLIKWARQGR